MGRDAGQGAPGPRDFTGPKRPPIAAETPPLYMILKRIDLDPLTVADNKNFSRRNRTSAQDPKRGIKTDSGHS